MSSGKKKIAFVLLLVLVLGGIYFIGTSSAVVKEKVGEEPKTNQTQAQTQQESQPANLAPDFTLTDMSGKQVRLSDLRGQKVLINFWTTWCKYCREEMPVLQKFYEQTKDKNWQVLMVNITSSEKSFSDVEKYLKENQFTFPVLLDKDGSVAAQYGINSIPTSFILNEKGEVVTTKIGPFREAEIEQLMK
ncbi:MAG: TlpA family protein disulfide reductase [Firmicutes bacterium]|nr:TlpA family protein disulfide reductase [Bacillota bacterium]